MKVEVEEQRFFQTASEVSLWLCSARFENAARARLPSLTVISDGDVADLLYQGNRTGYGSERTRLHSEAARIADLQQDLEAGFTARQALISSATLGGNPNLALVAFAWCVAQHDADPDRFPMERGGMYNLLWMYKWIGERLGEHPGVSRSKIAGLLADMSRRYTARGHSLRPVSKLELVAAIDMLDHEQIPSALRNWMRAGRDALSDCTACDIDCEAAAYLAIHDLQLARQAAEPIFERRFSCAEIPTLTYGRFLLPLSQAGESEQSSQFATVLPRRIGTNRDYVTAAGALVAFLVDQRSPAALRTAKRFSGWALEGETPLRRLVLMIALVHASRMAIKTGKAKEPLGVLMPNESPTSFEDAEQRLTRATSDLAAAFDARNGHSRVGEAVRAHLEGTGRWWSPL